jgi:hypothetical protein
MPIMDRLRKIMKSNPFRVSSKKTQKTLGINQTKETKDLYNENNKMLKKKLRQMLQREKTLHVHGLAKLILRKWLYYLK